MWLLQFIFTVARYTAGLLQQDSGRVLRLHGSTVSYQDLALQVINNQDLNFQIFLKFFFNLISCCTSLLHTQNIQSQQAVENNFDNFPNDGRSGADFALGT